MRVAAGHRFQKLSVDAAGVLAAPHKGDCACFWRDFGNQNPDGQGKNSVRGHGGAGSLTLIPGD